MAIENHVLLFQNNILKKIVRGFFIPFLDIKAVFFFIFLDYKYLIVKNQGFFLIQIIHKFDLSWIGLKN